MGNQVNSCHRVTKVVIKVATVTVHPFIFNSLSVRSENNLLKMKKGKLIGTSIQSIKLLLHRQRCCFCLLFLFLYATLSISSFNYWPISTKSRYEVNFRDLHSLFGQSIQKPDSKLINLKTYYDMRAAALRNERRKQVWLLPDHAALKKAYTWE